MKSLCVFCGSSPGTDPVYMQQAEALGRAAAEKGWHLVYGGGKAGLMGAVAEGAFQAGGRVTGVIPESIEKKVPRQDGIELIVCKTMHQRKQKMVDLSDGFLALPGGIGTIEEICEVWTWNQLGFLKKPLGFYNLNGFFDPLMGFFGNQVKNGFMKSFHLEQIIVEDRIDRIFQQMEAYRYTYIDKWQK